MTISRVEPYPAALPSGVAVQQLTGHDRRLRGLALRLLGDPGLVDDAMQEAYLRAFRALPGFRGSASLSTWLHRIVHNVCMDELRRRGRQPEEPYDDDRSIPPSPDTTEFTVERADLAAGLTELSWEHRAAIVLVDGYGLGHAEAADMLGVPVGTIASRTFRARAILRRTLAVRAA